MTEGIKKHAVFIFSAASVMFLAVISLSVYIFLDFRSDSRRDEYYSNLYETEMKSAAYFLRDSLESDDMMGAYYYSVSAADWAKRAGLTNEAGLFSRISEAVKEGRSEEYVRIIDSYIENGKFDESYDRLAAEDDLQTEQPTNKVYIPTYLKERAENIANRLFDTKNALKFIESSRGEELIFSCRNAYAVIDLNSCTPLEASISLEYRSPVLSDDECIASAKAFINEFFPVNFSAVASIADVRYENGNILSADFINQGRKITLMIERGRGKVVGITAR